MDEHGEHQDLHSSGHQNVIPYIHGRDECCIAMCILKSRLSLVVIGLARRESCVELEFQRACLNPLPTRSFYNSRLDSHIMTRGSTGDPEVVETLYNI
jgi:hypothetical protein